MVDSASLPSKPRAARLGIPGENPTPTVRVFIKSTGLGQRLSIGYTMNLLGVGLVQSWMYTHDHGVPVHVVCGGTMFYWSHSCGVDGGTELTLRE